LFPELHFKQYTVICNVAMGLSGSRGVVSSGEQRKFRREHPATLKIGMLHRKPATVPDGDFVYGRPSSQRTMEEIRRCG
jgi:hypothetical protein